jgi:hypothetical protein
VVIPKNECGRSKRKNDMIKINIDFSKKTDKIKSNVVLPQFEYCPQRIGGGQVKSV